MYYFYFFLLLLLLLFCNINIIDSIILPDRPYSYPISTYLHEGGNGQSDINNANNIQEATVNFVHGIQHDSKGGYYFSDSSNNRVRYVNNLGIVNTVVGSDTGESGNPTANVKGTNCLLNSPVGLAITRDNLLLIAAYDNHKIISYDVNTGYVQDFIGTGINENFDISKGNSPLKANSPFCYRLAIDSNENIYIILLGQKIILKYNRFGDNLVYHFAGGGSNKFGSGINPKLSALSAPRGMFISNSNDIYIADTSNFVIKKISARDNLIYIIAGTGKNKFQLASKYISPLETSLYFPYTITGDNQGNIYFSSENTLFKYSEGNSILSVLAGSGSLPINIENTNHIGNDMNLLSYPLIMEVVPQKSVINQNKFRNLLGISTLISKSVSSETQFYLLVGHKNYISRFIFQSDSERPSALVPQVPVGGECDAIYKLTDSEESAGRNDANRIEASLVSGVRGIVADNRGGLYFSDFQNHRVRYVTNLNYVITIIGNDQGKSGNIVHNQLGLETRINGPTGLEFNIIDNTLIVSLFGNNLICKYEIESQKVKLFIGSGSSKAFQGYFQPSLIANIGSPTSVIYDNNLNLYFSSFTHECIYVFSNNLVERVVGTGVKGTFSPDAPDQLSAGFNSIFSIDIYNGYLFITDYHNNAIRKLDLENRKLESVIEDQFMDHSGSLNEFKNPMGLRWVNNNMLFTANVTIDGSNMPAILKGSDRGDGIYHFTIISGTGSINLDSSTQGMNAFNSNLQVPLYCISYGLFDNNVYIGTEKSINIIKLSNTIPSPTLKPIPPPVIPTLSPTINPSRYPNPYPIPYPTAVPIEVPSAIPTTIPNPIPTPIPTLNLVDLKLFTTFAAFPQIELTEVDLEVIDKFLMEVFSDTIERVFITSVKYLYTKPFKDQFGNILYNENYHYVETVVQLISVSYPGMKQDEIINYYSALYESMAKSGVLTIKLRKAGYNMNYPYSDIIRVVYGEFPSTSNNLKDKRLNLTPIISVVVIFGVLIIAAIFLKDSIKKYSILLFNRIKKKKQAKEDTSPKNEVNL